jgi:hypothetical protein
VWKQLTVLSMATACALDLVLDPAQCRHFCNGGLTMTLLLALSCQLLEQIGKC